MNIRKKLGNIDMPIVVIPVAIVLTLFVLSWVFYFASKTYVSSGSSVKKGDILMEIDPNDVLADFNAIKVQKSFMY